MVNRTFLMVCLLAALAACERAGEPAGSRGAASHPATNEPKTISAAPEHFDRVRAEQFEKEEDRLRRRSRAN
jgi:hypothetical protein